MFTEKLGWNLDAKPSVERDDFDHPETVYVIAQNDEQRIAGCARLLPTTHPHLLGDVLPQLTHELPLPCSDDVWRLSRFAAMATQGPRQKFLAQHYSILIMNILHAATRYVHRNGAPGLSLYRRLPWSAYFALMCFERIPNITQVHAQ